MNDFKKGLLVGMLVMMGCMFFMAMRAVPQNGRFEILLGPTKNFNKEYSNLFDTQTGTVYEGFTHSEGTIWTKVVDNALE